MTNPTDQLRGVWTYPTTVFFGAGRIRELAKQCRRLGIARPLLVTDPGLAALPMVQDAVAGNTKAGVPTALFSEIRPNPVEANVRAGAAAFRDGGHDGIIAMGGGSALDSGKAIALIAQQDETPLWDFDVMSPNWRRDRTVDLPPVVAVPTTAGTGSEVGRAAVVADESTHTKRILIHSGMLPRVVIADPALSVGMPARITAGTGMDALAHNLEAYCCAVEYHPMADGIAMEGVRLVKEWLPVAVRDGGNLTARAHMLAAASMGAVAFQKGLGAIHALSHPVGALFDTHHGLTNAVVMPYVLRFNRPVIEEKMVRLARYLDLDEARFEAVLDWVLALRREIGVPHTLSELGVPEERIPELAEMSAADPTAPENPRPLDVAALTTLFEDAIAGNLG
ncbi:MAG: iron-containing alcohol dehydrogenase [Alphaproteobacteria bacterium]|nr:iron-containing alcohol dehydrogenase [Alphaproteobacteria bacterium]